MFPVIKFTSASSYFQNRVMILLMKPKILSTNISVYIYDGVYKKKVSRSSEDYLFAVCLFSKV